MALSSQQAAAILSNDPAALTNVLNMLSANDTATIKEGEKLLKPFLKTPNCIPSLINQLKTVHSPSVRHHAALLLKKKVARNNYNFYVTILVPD
jgi:hypothetical protein